MKIKNFKLHIKTRGFCDVHDLTKEACERVVDLDRRTHHREVILQVMGEE